MKIKGFMYAVVSAVFFGSAGIFIKAGYSQNLGPVELLIIQYIIASLILFSICIIMYRSKLKIQKKIMFKLILQGAFGNTLMTVFLYSSMAYLSVASTTILLYTYPAMVALYSFIFNGEKITKVKITAVLGTFAGCFLVLNIWPAINKHISFTGILFGILSAVFYSFMNIYADDIVDEVPPLVMTFYTTVFSLAALLIFNPSFLVKIALMQTDVLINAGELAFFCEIIPLTLLYAAIGKIGPVKASIVSTLEIPAAALVSFFIIGDKIVPIQFAGIILVILSILSLRMEAN